MTTLQGRTALVTGGASGIGAAIAHRLAELGAAVTVADLDEEHARTVAEAIGGTAWRVDLSDPDALDGGPERVDVLINNAGIQRVAPIVDFDPAAFHQMLMIMSSHPSG